MKTDYVTKNDLDASLRASTDEIIGVFQSYMLQVDERFNKIEHEIVEIKSSIIPLENL